MGYGSDELMTQPIAGATFAFTILVKDAADTDIAKTNPTIDSINDFLISVNGGSWDTLDNAPTVTPAGGKQ